MANRLGVAVEKPAGCQKFLYPQGEDEYFDMGAVVLET